MPTSSDPRLPDLFARASELEGDARAAWLADLHRAEPGLAREIEDLLASAAAGAMRFETPAWEWETAGGEPGGAVPPASVGPFRIVREIGRGGMGRVFLAEKETENFRCKVALKLLDRPGAGKEGSRRFREEARILAALEHPGIARFYDAGWTVAGTWRSSTSKGSTCSPSRPGGVSTRGSASRSSSRSSTRSTSRTAAWWSIAT